MNDSEMAKNENYKNQDRISPFNRKKTKIEISDEKSLFYLEKQEQEEEKECMKKFENLDETLPKRKSTISKSIIMANAILLELDDKIGKLKSKKKSNGIKLLK